MDPQDQFCHNPDCPARGQAGLGTIRIHSRAERRYRCTTCGRTFAETRGTPFYRLKKTADLVTLVLTLLCHGCPRRAIVAAFGLDERTVAAWRDRAGRYGQRFPEHHVLNGQVELGHVQADELYVKAVARRLGMAMAMAVPSRLGLAGYVTAFARVFRDPVRTRRAGRPRLVPTAGLLLGQVIKHHAGRRLVSITRRVVRGSAGAIAAVLAATGTGTGINTAYIERLNATFRGALSPLTWRGRAIARSVDALTAGMYLGGCAYNFGWVHDSLRIAAGAGQRRKWQERTPAMAAGLTDHRWTMREWLSQPIPLPPWLPPKRRGRPLKRFQVAMA